MLVAPLAGAAELLFPKPLHLTRRIDDPFARDPIVLDEYCAGNRVVTVRGERVIIADYDRQEVTEIDRAGATYSITRFDEIAKALPATEEEPAQIKTEARRLGADRFEVTMERRRGPAAKTGARTKIEVAVDRSVPLRRSALDVLLGAAYPYRPSAQHAAIVQSVGTALPSEHVTTHEFEGRQVVVRNVVTRVGDELVPAELTAIPPGAQRVESRFTAVNKTAEELDRSH